MLDHEMPGYLASVHVTKLQSAARLAGLRWKSGTPGYDKAGIIEKLSFSPSIMRACVAQLKRMEAGEGFNQTRTSGDNPFTADIKDEISHTPPQVKTEVSSASADALISGVLRRLESLEGYAISADTAETIARDEATKQTRPIISTVNSGFKDIDSRLEALEASKPVQINIGEIRLPEVSGQHERFPRMAKWLNLRVKSDKGEILSRTHCLLIGPAGTGKTTAAVAFAKMLGLDLYAQPLTVDAFGVTGFISPNGEIIETEFSRAWKNGGVLLWDELSMSAKDAIGALNSALANGFIALPGVGNIKAHPDFYFIAGDNSDTGASALFSARELLDGATLDRFIRLDWPVDLKLEQNLCNGYTDWLAAVRAIRAFIAQRDVAHVGATPRAVIMGSQALQAGCFSRLEILEDTCRKGVLIESWPQVLNLPEVATFLRG